MIMYLSTNKINNHNNHNNHNTFFQEMLILAWADEVNQKHTSSIPQFSKKICNLKTLTRAKRGGKFLYQFIVDS